MRRFSSCLLLLSLTLWATTASAHRFHHSLSEVTVNSERQTLEVALKVIPEDLETALQAQLGERVSLEHTDNVDAEIVKYLFGVFRFIGADDQQLDLIWMGKQVDHRAAWLYFEVPYHQPQTIEIHNAVLVGSSHGQQLNTLVISQHGEQQRLVFGDGTYRHSLTIQ